MSGAFQVYMNSYVTKDEASYYQTYAESFESKSMFPFPLG